MRPRSTACRVQRLKDQQQPVAVGRVVKTLERAQFLDLFLQALLIGLLRFAIRLHLRRPLLERDLTPRLNPEILGIDFHAFILMTWLGVEERVGSNVARAWAKRPLKPYLVARRLNGALG